MGKTFEISSFVEGAFKMKNIWKIELKKLHGKSIYFFLLLFCIFTTLDNILYYKLNIDKPDLTVGNFGVSLFLTQLYLIYLASTYITSDFNLGTSRSLFTGVYSRAQIINSKTIFLMIFSIILGIVNVIIGIVLQVIIISEISFSEIFMDAIKIILIYGLYFFSVLSFTLFISSIFLNRLYTIVINYVAFIFVAELAAQTIQRDSIALKNLIETLPFYLVTNGFNHLNYSIVAASILIAFSLLMYGMGLVIFRKRDLL